MMKKYFFIAIAPLAIFLFVGLTPRAHASGFTFVQSTGQSGHLVEFSSEVTKGDLLVVVASAKTGTDYPISVTDTAGNTWTSANAVSPNNATINERGNIFYTIAKSNASSLDVSDAFESGTTTNGTQIQAFEFSGDPGMTFALDATATAENTSAAPSTSITASGAGELIIGFLIHNNASAVTTGSDYTTGLNGSSWWAEKSEYNLFGASGAQDVDWNGSTSVAWSLTAAAFKEVRAPVAFVQVGTNTATATSTSVNLTTTPGDLLVGLCVISNSGTATSTVSDSAGHAWDSPEKAVFAGGSVGGLWYSSNITGGSTTSTCSIATSTAYTIKFSVAEYSGVATSDPLNAYATNGGYQTGYITPSITTSQAGDLIIGAESNEGNDGNQSASSPYTTRSSNLNMVLSDQVTSTIGTIAGATMNRDYGNSWVGYTFAFAPNPAVSLDASSTVNQQCTPTCTWSYTVGNQNNRLLVLSLPLGGWNGTSGGGLPVCFGVHCAYAATYDGESLTKAIMAQGVNYQDDELWYLINPPSGTHDIVLTIDTSTFEGYNYLTASSWFGIDQTNPIDATSSNSTSDGTATVSITSAHNGDTLVDVAQWQNANYAVTPGDSQVSLYKTAQYSGNSGTSYIPPASSASTQTFSWTGDPAGQTTLDVAMALKPAWSPPPPPVTMLARTVVHAARVILNGTHWIIR